MSDRIESPADGETAARTTEATAPAAARRATTGRGPAGSTAGPAPVVRPGSAAEHDTVVDPMLEAGREPGSESSPALEESAPPPGLTEATLEALLFVAERPLARREIASLAGVDRETVDARLGDLEVSLAGRGIRLLISGDRVELVTAPGAGPLVARYIGADAVDLTPAALETLAIVAYRQPVTKAAIERIRGVDSDYTVRVLVHRRLVVELGRSEAPGRPILYGTAFDFLERFGLASLEDLPPLDADVAARLVEATGEPPVARVPPAGMHGPSGGRGGSTIDQDRPGSGEPPVDSEAAGADEPPVSGP